MLALLRAIRLRQAAPDAVAAGVADTAAALYELSHQRDEDEHPALPPGEAHNALPPGEAHGALAPGEAHSILPPGAPRLGLPAASPHISAEGASPGQQLRPRWAAAAQGSPSPPPDLIDPVPPAGAGRVVHSPMAEDGEPPHFDDLPEKRADSASTGRSFWDRRPAPSRAPGGRPVISGLTSTPRVTRNAGPGGLPGDAVPPGLGRNEAGGAVAWPPVPGDSDAGGFDEDDGAEAVGRPHRNRFTGLPVRRPGSEIQPTTWPETGVEGAAGSGNARPLGGGSAGGARARWTGGASAGARPRWAAGGRGVPQENPSGMRRLPGMDLPHVMPPLVTRVNAGDGMDPADDALLRQTQRLLSTSLTFAGGPLDVSERLRAALMQAQPGLLATLPGGAATQVGQLAKAMTWLVHNLDRPPVLVEGCGRLGAALAACGIKAAQLQLVGAALAEAMRTGMAAGQWRLDFDVAWRSTWQHAYEWIVHGGASAAYAPPVWDAVVVEHQLRRPDLAVVRLRPFLPMPFRAGQYARIQVRELPAIWRPYSLAGAPARDDVVELHVRAKTESGVSGTLVHRTRVGDRVRLSRAEGTMTLPADPRRHLLMIAGDTGVVPFKALLTQLAETGDERSAVLFWGVRDLSQLYDIEALTEIARAARRATVVPVVAEGDPGPYAPGLVTEAVAAYGEWSGHEVFLAGPPLMVAATSVALHQLGVAPERIHHDPPE